MLNNQRVPRNFVSVFCFQNVSLKWPRKQGTPEGPRTDFPNRLAALEKLAQVPWKLKNMEVSAGKTMVSAGKTMVSAGKTMVFGGKTIVFGGKAMVFGGKTMVFVGKTMTYSGFTLVFLVR